MSLNIDPLIDDMCHALNFPGIIVDVMRNTCYLGQRAVMTDSGYVSEYLRSKAEGSPLPAARRIRQRLTGSSFSVLIMISC